jgi:hypothetical protein
VSINETINNSCTAADDAMILNGEFGRKWKDAVLFKSDVPSGICLEELREIKRNHSG